MGLLNRISIGAKVGLGFGLLVVLLVTITTVSYQSLHAARNNLAEYRHLARQSNELGRIQTDVVEIRLHALKYLYSGDDESVREVRARGDRLAAQLKEARTLFDDRDAQDTLAAIDADSRAYLAAFQRVVELGAPQPNRGPGDLDTASAGERGRLIHDKLYRLGPAFDTAIDTLKLANLSRQETLGPRADADAEQAARTAVSVSVLAIVLGVAASLVVSAAIARPVIAMTGAMRRLAEGELTVDIPARDHQSEVGAMAKAVQVFKEALCRLEEQRSLAAQVSEISTALQLAESPASFAEALLDRLVPRLGAALGLLYVRDPASGRFHVAGGYACQADGALSKSFAAGEGLPGQCVASGRILTVTGLPAGSHIIASGLTAGRPDTVACIPVATQEGVLGVIEVARYGVFTGQQRELLDLVVPVAALNLGLLERNLRTSTLLEQTRSQAEELRVQTEELQASEDELRIQREELQAANEALEHKTFSLERQAEALEGARAEASRRAAEVAAASQYKTQFLANMSHELRTPLNSIIILAKTLPEDDSGHLSPGQIESARMIGESGNHLLALINDILDLSKIEAGKLDLVPEDFRLDEVLDYVSRVFAPEAARKRLTLAVDVAPGMPLTMRADRQRFTQVLINLVGNAVKFTDDGEVRIAAGTRDGNLCFSVRDTGIGIAADRIDHIFGAFQQLDGTTSRRYGGTGLGLSICKSLMELMGGHITVSSTPGVGSVFTVLLPEGEEGPVAASVPDPQEMWLLPPAPPMATVEIAESKAEPAGRPVLVIDPDQGRQAIFGRLISSLGYASASAASGKAALAAVAGNRPAAILLDLDLPDMPGLDVLRRLKADPESAVVPLFVMSADASVTGPARTLGAMGRLGKPVTRDEVVAALKAMIGIPGAVPGRRRMLVVEDNAIDAVALEKLFRRDAIDMVVARTGEEAMHRLTDGRFDAVILDLMLPDMSGFTLLERMCAEADRHPPVIVYSAHDLTSDDIYHLRTFAESVVVKGRISSRLREEVLHAIDDQSDRHGVALADVGPDRGKGRRLLLVDDDVRNLVALSKGLRLKGFEVEVAPDGAKALDRLTEGKFDAVLTDIMMPGMDGYELIRRIRAGGDHLPIIALTAKAMQGDADLCLRAGANGYLAKPIDLDRLLEMLG